MLGRISRVILRSLFFTGLCLAPVNARARVAAQGSVLLSNQPGISVGSSVGPCAVAERPKVGVIAWVSGLVFSRSNGYQVLWIPWLRLLWIYSKRDRRFLVIQLAKQGGL